MEAVSSTKMALLMHSPLQNMMINGLRVTAGKVMEIGSAYDFEHDVAIGPLLIHPM